MENDTSEMKRWNCNHKYCELKLIGSSKNVCKYHANVDANPQRMLKQIIVEPFSQNGNMASFGLI